LVQQLQISFFLLLASDQYLPWVLKDMMTIMSLGGLISEIALFGIY
jgi:hypothetical protein